MVQISYRQIKKFKKKKKRKNYFKWFLILIFKGKPLRINRLLDFLSTQEQKCHVPHYIQSQDKRFANYY